ncbi:MAG: hydrogenase formation protein HypD [Dictyoglomus thermophilum]|nr:hydrogenase formation protein HypD [Dictyoglomus thermophilum]MCX7720658.1 hydrogenase formation protein HypD [Dictyoglomus thermophilum]
MNIDKLIHKIKEISTKEINIMEFCGTHTHEIFRYGISEILPTNIHLLSGPGCPVCVTAEEDIDYIIALSQEYNLGIITFGDLINVPGSLGSLNHLRARGKEVRVVYSPLESLNIAKENPHKKYLLVGIGFETTAPNLAYTLIKATEENIKNLYFLSLHKLTPPAMKAILDMGEIKLDGIIGPGHVSTIIGRVGWKEIFEKYRVPFVIMGFKPEEIVYGIYHLVKIIEEGEPKLLNAYERSVKEEGNKHALEVMYKVFKKGPANWRGLGIIEESGLVLREEFEDFDVRRIYPLKIEKRVDNYNPCKCGEVLRGVLKPTECPLFGKACTPEYPKGPCMVSSEGTCSAYYLYGGV